MLVSARAPRCACVTLLGAGGAAAVSSHGGQALPSPGGLDPQTVRRVSPLADSRPNALRRTNGWRAESRGAVPSPERREIVSPAATAPRAVPLCCTPSLPPDQPVAHAPDVFLEEDGAQVRTAVASRGRQDGGVSPDLRVSGRATASGGRLRRLGYAVRAGLLPRPRSRPGRRGVLGERPGRATGANVLVPGSCAHCRSRGWTERRPLVEKRLGLSTVLREPVAAAADVLAKQNGAKLPSRRAQHQTPGDRPAPGRQREHPGHPPVGGFELAAWVSSSSIA